MGASGNNNNEFKFSISRSLKVFYSIHYITAGGTDGLSFIAVGGGTAQVFGLGTAVFGFQPAFFGTEGGPSFTADFGCLGGPANHFQQALNSVLAVSSLGAE